LVAGFTGQFSVAHHALATIGAYSSAAMALALGAPIAVAVLAGGVAAAVLGYLLALVTLKSRGIYFALSTWAFAETVRILLSQQYRITRGDNGLSVPFLFDTIAPWPYYYTLLTAAIGAVALSVVLMRRKVGFRMRAIRDDEEIANSLGIDVTKWKRRVFAFTAGMAGVAGALYGHTVGLITPSQANFKMMTFIIIFVVFGGLRTIWGPVIGAFVVQGLAESLRVSEELRLVIFGFLVVVIMRVYPPGIMGALRAGAGSLARRRRSHPPLPALADAGPPT
jgi:branched-chain amino acid transport system permease protein